MLIRAKDILVGFYYSLPIQLVVFQVKDNKSILLWWAFLFMFVSGNVGKDFGIPYLFLEPEYMGETSIWSMMLIGASLAAFIASYQIAMYILESYRFHFLALEENPFHIFYLNNFILPFCFLVYYSERFISFQVYTQGGFDTNIFLYLFGLYSGVTIMLFLIAGYFYFTNQNIFKVFGKAIAHELRRPRTILEKAKIGLTSRNRVDFYFTAVGKLEKVDRTLPVDLRSLVRILNQNHSNALFLELILVISIVVLGFGEDVTFFQVPAGVSVLLAFSVIMMFVSAITFWFRKIGPLSFLVLILALVGLDKIGFFDGRHQALGMNYEVKPAEYTPESLALHASEKNISIDYLNTVTILNRWKADYKIFHKGNRNPKAVLICTSGGGHRSGYFTFRAMQVLDSLSKGEFFENSRLITGASGGMIGAAYFRDLYLRKKLGRPMKLHDRSLALPIAKDLLNRVTFKIVSGIFLPHMTDKIGSREYSSDRGYSFDEQLQDNIPEFKDRRLGDYVLPETDAMIPMMVLSPVIINDGRKLFISSTPVSYLARTVNPHEGIGIGVTGIEFKRFFREQEPDSLLFATALRMNASFPLITPFVALPSDPPLKLIDAGVADNFGITTAIRFLYVFREWFAQNTEGVMILQIRDTEREIVPSKENGKTNFLGKIFDPLGAFYSSYTLSRDFANEDFLNFSGGLFKGNLEFASIEYVPEDTIGTKASLSWHLTSREVNYIENSLRQPKNKMVFERIVEWIK